MAVPARPKLYHITHVDNLASIVRDVGLLPDSARRTAAIIGMPSIKARRLSLPVPPHPGDHVGDSVPFYFCPRSIMLYLIHRANHPELAYRGGQGPIVHLEADLYDTAEWATANGHRWCFTLSNAGARYAEFRADLACLPDIDWDAVASTDFRSATVKERKQAEFLVHGFFPWDLVERIGVCSDAVAAQVRTTAAGSCPRVDVLPEWYY